MIHPGGCRSVRLAAVFLGLWVTSAAAEPYLAVRQGMDCGQCHVNPSGGGLRNAFGNVYGQNQLSATPNTGITESWTGEFSRYFAAGGNLRVAATQADIDNTDTNLDFATQRATLYLGVNLHERVSLYIDQQVAPGGSLNREAWIKLNYNRFYLKAGKMFMPFGWRLEDNNTLVRQISGINMLQGDDGLEIGWSQGAYSVQLAATNGNGGAAERDDGKQFTLRAARAASRWQLGISAVNNNTDFIDRAGGGVFAGLQTGAVTWLLEYNLLEDKPDAAGADEEFQVGLLEANWLISRGHNLKLTAEHTRSDLTRDSSQRYGLVYEATPLPFAQVRIGYRERDSDNNNPLLNGSEGFIELHGFF